MPGNLPPFLLSPPRPYPADSPRTKSASGATFLDKGLAGCAALLKTTFVQWDTARRKGFSRNWNAGQVIFPPFFCRSDKHQTEFLPSSASPFDPDACRLSLLGPVVLLPSVFASELSVRFLVALPSCLNVITPGEILLPLVDFPEERCFFAWCLPKTVGITRQGLEGTSMLTLRVFNSLSLSFLVIYTTPFSEMIRALKSLNVPDLFLLIIALSYQYILIFAKVMEDLHLARKSKLINNDSREARDWVAGRMAFLFRRTKGRCEEVFSAMLSRGFTGEIKLYAPRKLECADLAWTALLFFPGMLLLII